MTTALTVLSFVWDQLDGHKYALLALAWLWHHVSSSTTDRLVEVAKQVAKIGFAVAKAQLQSDPHFDPYHFEAMALDRCKVQLDKLGIPFAGQIVGLVKHEIDSLLADLALEQLPHQVDEVSERADDVVKSMLDAKTEGAAKGAELHDMLTVERVDETSTQKAPDASGPTAAAGEPSSQPPAPAAAASQSKETSHA